jgi:guanylate kinase
MSEAPQLIKGHVIILMAPSGSGKGTLVRRALKEYPAIYHTVSCTSRAKRPAEIEGKDYNFLSPEAFTAKVAAGDFLEWAEFAGNKYGTLKTEVLPKIADCTVVMAEIELQGVEQLLKLLPRDHMTIVYIESGGWDILKKRIEGRAPISEEELAGRHTRYLVESEAKALADVIINNTGDITVAHNEFKQVIEDAYSRCVN